MATQLEHVEWLQTLTNHGDMAQFCKAHFLPRKPHKKKKKEGKIYLLIT